MSLLNLLNLHQESSHHVSITNYNSYLSLLVVYYLRDILSDLILMFYVLFIVSKIVTFSHVILGRLMRYHGNRTSTLCLIREQFA